MLFLYTLTWQSIDKLTRLKESLLPNITDLDYKWYIKDNGSTDNTVEIASTWGPDIIPLKYPNNLQNFSEGMNYCFNESKPNDDDIICLLNNDVVFNDTTSIKKMIKYFDNPEVGVVGCRLLFNGTNKLQHAGVVFYERNLMPGHFRSGEESDAQAEKDRYFQAVTGAVLMLRAKDYKQVCTENASKINGMREELRWAFDDIDLCIAIRNLGKKILYCGSTNIYHEESASLKKNPVNKLFMANNTNVFKKYWSSKIKPDLEIYKKDPNYNLVNSKK